MDKFELNGNGDFDVSSKSIVSLKGCPTEINGNFDCRDNDIRSLEYGPQKVSGYYNCSRNKIESLEGCTREIYGTFDCSSNRLKSLDHFPSLVNGGVYVNHNELTSLKGCVIKTNATFSCQGNSLTSLVGGPKKVGGNLECDNNLLTNFEGFPEEIGGWFINCSNNNITSLKDIHRHIKKMNTNSVGSTVLQGVLHLLNCDIKSHVLGVLMIEGLTSIVLDNDPVEKILNKHLARPFTHARMYECQDELIEAGFEEYAQL